MAVLDLDTPEWWIEIDETPVAVSVVDWAKWKTAADVVDARRVDKSYVGDFLVSSVFLSGRAGAAGMYEVAVFGRGDGWLWGRNLHTRVAAQAEHDAVVLALHAGATIESLDGCA